MCVGEREEVSVQNDGSVLATVIRPRPLSLSTGLCELINQYVLCTLMHVISVIVTFDVSFHQFHSSFILLYFILNFIYVLLDYIFVK